MSFNCLISIIIYAFNINVKEKKVSQEQDKELSKNKTEAPFNIEMVIFTFINSRGIEYGVLTHNIFTVTKILSMILISGIKKRYTFISLILGSISFIGLILSAPYRMKRIYMPRVFLR